MEAVLAAVRGAATAAATEWLPRAVSAAAEEEVMLELVLEEEEEEG